MTYETTLPLRSIEAVRIRRPTPRTVRVTFGGPDLAGFALAGPDQQVKLYFPRPGQPVPVLPEPAPDGDVMRWYQAYAALPEDVRPWMRSYTIRAHHPQDGPHGTVDIDFVLHAGGAEGPATRWAASAEPGDTLGMFGPSAQFARPVRLGTADWTLLIGDDTALPALATIAEALPSGARAIAYIEVADAAEEQPLPGPGDLTVHWLHRDGAAPGRGLLDAVRDAALPAGSVYGWLAGEAGTVRALRRHLVDERGIDKRSLDFAGYWRRRLTQDDAPTEEDLADARELMDRAAEPVVDPVADPVADRAAVD